MQQDRIFGGSSARPLWCGARILLVMLTLLGAIPATLHAQAYYGAIVGNVTDASGAAIVGAKVTAIATTSEAPDMVLSASRG